MLEIRISAIQVGQRHRKELGDIPQLATSIEELGLLQPIGITPDKKLVFGLRRLKAFEHLGRASIPYRTIDVPKIVDGEIAENNLRKDFVITERVAIAEAVASELGERRGGRHGSIPNSLGNEHYRETRHIAAQKANLGSGETLRKAQLVIKAALEDSEKYGDLPAKMDKLGKVQPAYGEMIKRKDSQRVRNLRLQAGRFHTLVLDPPWDEYVSGPPSRGNARYATMTFEQLQQLPIADHAEDDCHLWLWAINRSLLEAFNLLPHWGFTYRSILTWVKPRMGMGRYLRNTTEHCLFATKGNVGIQANDIRSHFEADIGEHSAKPDEFYEIVRRASLPPYGEMFQRTKRAGFKNLYKRAVE